MMPLSIPAVLLSLALQAGSGVPPQGPGELSHKPPVQWSLESPPPSIRSGDVFSLQVAARIEPGWHLYALEEPEGGPAPTHIGVASTDPVRLLRVAEPPPHRLQDVQTRVVAAAFEGAATFTLRLRAARTRGASDLHVLLVYQACNDRMCLPPHREVLSAPLRIEP